MSVAEGYTFFFVVWSTLGFLTILLPEDFYIKSSNQSPLGLILTVLQGPFILILTCLVFLIVGSRRFLIVKGKWS